MFRVRVGDGKNLLDEVYSLCDKMKDLVARMKSRSDGWGILVESAWSEFVPL